MAYVNFSELPPGGNRPRELYRTAPGAHRTGFTGLEWQVIALSQRDALSTLRAPSRLTLALENVFGFKNANPALANRSLEALRRVAVLAWHYGETVAHAEIATFYAAGFNPAQLRTLQQSIAAGRAKEDGRARA